MNILMRRQFLMNTDHRRRCYNGCHYSCEWKWTDWEVLEYNIPEEDIQRRIEFWKELNDYAVSQRGENARREFKACTGEPS